MFSAFTEKPGSADIIRMISGEVEIVQVKKERRNIMLVARVMNVAELEKFDEKRTVLPSGKYFGGEYNKINNMGIVCNEPQVTFFDPFNDGIYHVLTRMWSDENPEEKQVVLFSTSQEPVRGLAEGKYEELYFPCYSSASMKKIWQSSLFSTAWAIDICEALNMLRGHLGLEPYL